MKNNNTDNYKIAIKFLQQKQQQIKSIANKKERIASILKQIVGKIQNKAQLYEHLGIIVYLNHNNLLLKLFNQACAYHKTNKNQEIQKYLLSLYGYSYQCFLKYANKDYQTIYQYFNKNGKNFKLQNHKVQIPKPKQQRYQIIKKQLINVLSHLTSQNSYEQIIIEINLMIKSYQIFKFEAMGSQECVQTYLQLRIQQMHKKYGNKQYGLCCKLHFSQNQTIPTISPFISSYKLQNGDYLKWADGLIVEAKKFVVSYLNGQGGIFFIGLNIKDKEGTASGIQVNNKNKLELINYLLSDLILKIYPTGENLCGQTQKQQQARLQSYKNIKSTQFSSNIKQCKKSFLMNSFITVDFVNVYNKQSLFFERKTSQSFIYMIRIKVTRGLDYQTYFLVNKKDQNAQAYILDKLVPAKLSMTEFLQKIRTDVKNKVNGKEIKKRQHKFHKQCSFSKKELQNV